MKPTIIFPVMAMRALMLLVFLTLASSYNIVPMKYKTSHTHTKPLMYSSQIRQPPTSTTLVSVAISSDSVEDSSMVLEEGTGFFSKAKKASKIIYKFCRPHTIKVGCSQ